MTDSDNWVTAAVVLFCAVVIVAGVGYKIWAFNQCYPAMSDSVLMCLQVTK